MNDEETALLKLVKKYKIDPWNSIYYNQPIFTTLIEKYAKSNLTLGNYYDDFIVTILGRQEVKDINKNMVALIGLAPNSPPHLGTLLQLLAGNSLKDRQVRFIVSFNDIEAQLVRNTSRRLVVTNISREYNSAFYFLNIKPDEIVIRSKIPELSSYVEQIRKISREININDYYGRELNDNEKLSVFVMCAEFLRITLKYKNVVTFYSIEESSHLLYIRQVMKHFKLKPPICYVSRQIPSFDIGKKMSKSQCKNIYYSSKPTHEILKGISILEKSFIDKHTNECPYEYIDNILLGGFLTKRKHICSVKNHNNIIKAMRERRG